jgi:hypothetical protein
MYPYRTTKPLSAESIELRAIENERKAHWFFTTFKWLAGATGCVAVFVLVAGLRQASTLSTQVRPGVGPGFSEATTAAIGAQLFSGGLSLLSFVFVMVALVHAKSRLRTLAFSLPAAICILLLLTRKHWAF